MKHTVQALSDRKTTTILVATVLVVAIGSISIYYTLQAQQVREADFLQALWQTYKHQHYSAGRAIDEQNGNVTTSEGQAYTLLRAVWENDPSTFNETWNWTTDHLERNDNLFSWRYGFRGDGSMGILTDQGGENTASDADTEIAFALLMAGTKWRDTADITAAQNIIRAIWREEVITVNGTPYLTADNLEKSGSGPTFVVNPSYIAPYAYRVFAIEDPGDNWQGLVNSSYAFLNTVIHAPLDVGSSVGLPPDWVAVNRITGQLQAPIAPGQTTDFGFNAFRVVWQVSLDWQWNRDARARHLLQQFGFLKNEWVNRSEILAVYGHNGQPKVNYSSLAMYGGTLGYFMQFDSSGATQIVRSQFAPLYGGNSQRITRSISYYDNNWVWFGYALYAGRLQNVMETSR